MIGDIPVNERLVIEDDGTSAVITILPETFKLSLITNYIFFYVGVAIVTVLVYFYAGWSFPTIALTYFLAAILLAAPFGILGAFFKKNSLKIDPDEITTQWELFGFKRSYSYPISDLEMPELMPPLKLPLAKHDTGFFIYATHKGRTRFLIKNAELSILDAKRIVILLKKRAWGVTFKSDDEQVNVHKQATELEVATPASDSIDTLATPEQIEKELNSCKGASVTASEEGGVLRLEFESQRGCLSLSFFFVIFVLLSLVGSAIFFTPWTGEMIIQRILATAAFIPFWIISGYFFLWGGPGGLGLGGPIRIQTKDSVISIGSVLHDAQVGIVSKVIKWVDSYRHHVTLA